MVYTNTQGVILKDKNKLAMFLVAIGFAIFATIGMILPASASTSEVVYNNIPDPTPGNVPSLGYAATSTTEFGSQVGLDGVSRDNPSITVLMSSWACESGHWNNGDCESEPGATYSHDLTLNLYEVNTNESVGSLLATSTDTFDVPFRPSANDVDCTGGTWYDGTNCNNGYAFDVTFEFPGVTLPDNVIVGIEFNTSNYGNNPLGTDTTCYGTSEGCPYDSLNVGLNIAPSIGESLPSIDDVYWNTDHGPFYCDEGADGVGTFRLDAGCWTGYLPAILIEAEEPDTTPPAQVEGMTIFQNGEEIGCNAIVNERAITVDWNDSEADDFDYYVYQADDDGIGTIDFETTTTQSERTGNIRDLDGTYQYRVAAVDTNGNPGEFSEWCTVTLDRSVPEVAADCKKGGWENFLFLDFRNQGDCVSYVVSDNQQENNPDGNRNENGARRR